MWAVMHRVRRPDPSADASLMFAAEDADTDLDLMLSCPLPLT